MKTFCYFNKVETVFFGLKLRVEPLYINIAFFFFFRKKLLYKTSLHIPSYIEILYY